MIDQTNGRKAATLIRGGPLAPQITGVVWFMDIPDGTGVWVNIQGLPPYQPGINGQQPIGPHGFHIHQVGNCSPGTASDPFPNTGEHWNPTNQPHGNHPGDFPVLFSNNGKCLMYFFTDKFSVDQIVGKSVVIHQNPDDYRTQPAGNSGKKLACGVIQWCGASCGHVPD